VTAPLPRDDGPITPAPRAIQQALRTLPPIPAILRELNEALSSGRTDAREVAALVGKDAGLTAHLLKIVNSPYYGLARPVSDLRLAIAYAGMSQVHTLVRAILMVKTLGAPVREELLRFWRHSYFTALTSRHLVRHHLPHLDPAELWSPALLHDIGTLAYLRLFPKHFAALRAHQAEHKVLLEEAEEALGYPNHTDLGGHLAAQWNLPPLIVDVVSHHGSPDATAIASPTTAAMVSVISTSARLAELAGEELCDETRDRIRQEVCAALRIESAAFIDLMGAIYAIRNEVDGYVRELL
jgi:HD-like signal output (HDOD) protein